MTIYGQKDFIYEENGIGSIDFSTPFLQKHAMIVLESFKQTFGKSLIDYEKSIPPAAVAQSLFHIPSAVLSHDRMEVGNGVFENIYTYANRSALLAFERSFAEQTVLPSRKSAAPQSKEQKERNSLLIECFKQGKLQFSAERLSATGKRVLIHDGLLFNLFDERGVYHGQAVVLKNIEVLS